MKIDSNNSLGAIDLAISGLRAQNRSIKVISSNIANAQSTDNGNGQAYRRMEAILRSEGDGISGVDLEDVVEDMSDLPRVLKPGHPHADAQGYVTMPNVDLPIEMMNLNIATRAYQANAAVLRRYQRMVETTLELLR